MTCLRCGAPMPHAIEGRKDAICRNCILVFVDSVTEGFTKVFNALQESIAALDDRLLLLRQALEQRADHS